MTNVSAATEVYGLIGKPVRHSLSPLMQNRAFAAAGHDAVYAAFEVHDLPGAMAGIRALGLGGASITIPYKEAVLPFLEAVEGPAAKIGAVNTVVNQDGRLVGHNTDAPAAVQALLEKTAVKGKDVLILGAGGAARAVGYGLMEQGGRIHIANRSAEKGERLARAMGADFHPLSGIADAPCDILINSTPVGMHPETEAMPVPAEFLNKGMTVMDIIYNPVRTRLLSAAEAAGARAIDGVSMFVYQGALQFELWTGRKAPVDLMKTVVYAALEEHSPPAS
jgi:shikimate dehydrogenase